MAPYAASIRRAFTVDILNDSLVAQDPGPIYNALSVTMTAELDKAGEVIIEVPATHSRVVDLAANEQLVRIRTKEGLTKIGIIKDLTIKSGEQPIYILSGPDLLGELAYLNTGQNLNFDNEAVDSVIIGATGTSHSLLHQTGWTQGSVDGDLGNATIQFDNQSRLEALIILANQLGEHFRQGSTERTLDFGSFGADSGLILRNVERLTPDLEDNDDLVIIDAIEVVYDSHEIENEITALGGNGLTMENATGAGPEANIKVKAGPRRGSSTLSGSETSGATEITVVDGSDFVVDDPIFIGDADDWSADHETNIVTGVSGNDLTLQESISNNYSAGTHVMAFPAFYVEDTASQSTYGTRSVIHTWSDIKAQPIANGEELTAADLERASNMLYQAAVTRLAGYAEKYQRYRITNIVGLPYTLAVGQTIRLIYLGAVFEDATAVEYVDVDDDFYVLKISYKLTGDGKHSATIEIAETDRPAPKDADLIVNLMSPGVRR